jgi:hypothetical protein
VSNKQDTHNVPEEEMPDPTETTKAGSDAQERSSVPDIEAAGVEAVPELAPQLPIEVSGDETLPLPSVREEKRTVSAKEKLPQKTGGHGGASGSSKKGVDRQCQKDNGADTGSNPYSMERALEGLIEGNIVRLEAAPTVAEHSPRKRKKAPMSLAKVNPGEGVGEGGASKVTCLPEVGSILAVNAMRRTKLLIFNIHGTLLDCSLKVEINPNPTIRASVQTRSRRVVFRPGLIQFLSQCFMEFTVAFWGGKSESNMEDVVAAVLTRLKGRQEVDPLFV